MTTLAALISLPLTLLQEAQQFSRVCADLCRRKLPVSKLTLFELLDQQSN